MYVQKKSPTQPSQMHLNNINGSTFTVKTLPFFFPDLIQNNLVQTYRLNSSVKIRMPSLTEQLQNSDDLQPLFASCKAYDVFLVTHLERLWLCFREFMFSQFLLTSFAQMTAF